MNEVEGLVVERDDALLRFRFDRASHRNALTNEIVGAMVEHLEDASNDDTVRAIALSGSGDDFCSGADWVARNEPGVPRPRVGAMVRRTQLFAHRLVWLLLDIQLPVVCTVRGWAAGLGCHIALAADFTVAAETARFWEPFGQRGFTPDSGATWLLPRLVGLQRAKDMLLLGREVSGTEAESWGLIHRAVPEAELDEVATALTAELLAGPTAAIGLTKYCMHRSLELPFDQALELEAFALELSSRSADFKEGLRAFKAKEPPSFEGR